MSSKHDPNRFDKYQEIHETIMERYRRDGFVLRDNLAFSPIAGQILLIGEITCQGDIYIEVDKALEVIEGEGATALVQTVSYRYNVVLRKRGNILRYESAHPTHKNYHHVHRYKVLDGDKVGTVERLTVENWPTLGEVIAEVFDWYYANYDLLDR